MLKKKKGKTKKAMRGFGMLVCLLFSFSGGLRTSVRALAVVEFVLQQLEYCRLTMSACVCVCGN